VTDPVRIWQDQPETGGDDALALEHLALELAQGKTNAEAAKAAGVSERTIYRRLAEPPFRRRVRAIRAEMLREAIGRLAALRNDAIDALAGLLKGAKEQVRLRAAKTILDGLFRGEVCDLADQVAEVRGELEALKQHARDAAIGSLGSGPSASGHRGGPAAGEPDLGGDPPRPAGGDAPGGL
jgi:hypothetical protein